MTRSLVDRVRSRIIDEGVAPTSAGGAVDVIARLIADNPALADEEAFLATAARGGELHVFGSGARIGRIDSGRVAARFGFDPCPVPPPGQPDC